MKTIVKKRHQCNTALGKLEDGTILAVTREISNFVKIRYSVNKKTIKGTGADSLLTKYLTEFKILTTLTA